MSLRRAADADWPSLVGRFGQQRIAVVGDAILDEWIEGRAASVAREAPVPTVDVQVRRHALGGAANVAANITSLGGRARLVTVLGDDLAGAQLRELLRAASVGARWTVATPARATRSKRRVVAQGQVLARFDDGDDGPLSPVLDQELATAVRAASGWADSLVISDYAAGCLAGPATREALAQAARRGLVLLDAHEIADWGGLGAGIVKPNWEEACRLLNVSSAIVPPELRAGMVAERGPEILQRAGAPQAVVTLDGDGAVFLREGERAQAVSAHPVAEPHSAGAGDAVAAGLVLAQSAGARLRRAVEVGMAAAAVCVRQPGTVRCTAADLLDTLRARPERDLRSRPRRTSDTQREPLGLGDLLTAAREHRARGRRVVLTNGCFDVLHAGHVALLQAAAQAGDILVVAVNDDAGVRRIKGEGRPVNHFADRVRLLGAISCVDYLIGFSSDAPLGLINALRPEVFVKGASHDVERLPEARLVRSQGGQVVTVPLLADHSTSAVIAACGLVGVGQP